MPANFPEVWLGRVIRNLTSANMAPWLDGIAELPGVVQELGAGSESEMNVIHIPRSLFKPDVLVNNTAYPIAIQEYTDDSVIVALDKYQTKATSLSDDQIVGASYDQIDVITKGHTEQIGAKKYKKALHSIAPTADSANTPIIEATGDPVVVDGPATLTYQDLVTGKEKYYDSLGETPAGNLRLVLCNRHWMDLLRDRERFGDKLVNHNTGMPAPAIAGFELFTYVGSPLYTAAGAKKAYGAIKEAGDREGSIIFDPNNIAKKTGMTKQYFRKAEIDPQTQTNLLNYRHYFIATPMENKYIGAIL